MSLCQVHWFSQVLLKQVGMYVLLPDGGKPPFATFYLLHGLSDDYTIWLRRTRIEMYAAELPLMVVMPDGFRGFYTNNDEGPAYARYIGEELPCFVERNFPARAERDARFIGGLSMGGYGAMRIAMQYCDRYSFAASHSGAVGLGSIALREFDGGFPKEEYRRIFGRSPQGSEHDLIHLAKQARRKKLLPKLMADCGTEDFLLSQNRKFHADLEKLGVPHSYREHPGEHNWDYWDLHVREVLAEIAKMI